jgi:hypothetical protein
MVTIGLILAVAASGCCAYLAGMAVERWVTWPKPHGWPWAMLITGVMTAVNVGVVAAAAHLEVPLRGGGLPVIMQIQTLIVLPVFCAGFRERVDAVSTAFVSLNIGFLAVQLVGMRLASAGPAATFEASLWWLGGSWILLSRLAFAGMRQERRRQDAGRGREARVGSASAAEEREGELRP